MGSNTDKPNKLTNGDILIISTVLKHVMSSSAEAEIVAVFLNAKQGTVLRTTLEESGQPQPQHLYRLTTPQPQDTSMEQSNKNEHGPWICASIGSKTG
jgi:hypothetical protein